MAMISLAAWLPRHGVLGTVYRMITYICYDILIYIYIYTCIYIYIYINKYIWTYGLVQFFMTNFRCFCIVIVVGRDA